MYLTLNELAIIVRKAPVTICRTVRFGTAPPHFEGRWSHPIPVEWWEIGCPTKRA